MAERPTALVVGATRGIGAQVARGLARAGYDLALTGRAPEALAPVAAECGAWGAQVSTHLLEVTDVQRIPEVVAEAWEARGGLGLAVLVAGVIEAERPLWEVDPAELRRVIEVNTTAPMLLVHALAPRMIAAGGGRIVNLNSGSGTRASEVYPAYSASKAALSRITGSTTLAGAPHGLLAFDLAPGVVRTDMTGGMPMHEGRTDWTEPEEVVELVLALGSGDLDAWAGRMVRAGADAVETLKEAADRLAPADRTLVLQPYGPEDPLA